jgi:hypothetical protein
MFRRRIYAQFFTILAMVGGSVYWESDRAKRRQYEGLIDEKKKKEKHEAWIRELEIREQEEEELRKLRDKIVKGQAAERQRLTEGEKRTIESNIKNDTVQSKSGWGVTKSVLEDTDLRREGPITSAVRMLWKAQR